MKYALALLFLIPAGIANAQTATETITITATVTGACGIDGSATDTDTLALVINPGGSVSTATVHPAGSPYANVSCNVAADLALSSQNDGLTGPSPAAGFDHIINYTATATWSTASATLTTTGGVTAPHDGTPDLGDPATGALTVSVTPAANTNPLAVGSYEDILTVTLTPDI
jgi:hypothetical protein